MTSEHVSEQVRLQGLIDFPREDIDVEYKNWLNLKSEKDRATFAKAAIALANHGGGYLVLGFEELNSGFKSTTRPKDIPTITQDSVNSSIRRFAEPEFHAEMYSLDFLATGASHPVIRIHGSDVPVVARRDQLEAGVSQYKVYVRKPGPRSEEAHTAEEWRTLLDRCVRARREEMLDSIRSMVLGQPEAMKQKAEPIETLKDYCDSAYRRWTEIVSMEPPASPSRFPTGYYEMGFALVDAVPAEELVQLRDRLKAAHRTKLSGWSPFLDMQVPELSPYAHEDFVEAWLGRPIENKLLRDSVYCDYWRASLDGKLYTIRGYTEDSEWIRNRGYEPGKVMDIDTPILRVTEGLLFASRLAEYFESVQSIAVNCKFSGLSARCLVSLNPMLENLWPSQFISRTPSSELPSIHVEPVRIRDNLPEIIYELLKSCYARFNCFELSLSQVQRTLEILRPLSS